MVGVSLVDREQEVDLDVCEFCGGVIDDGEGDADDEEVEGCPALDEGVCRP